MSESRGLFQVLRSVPPGDPLVTLLIANVITIILAMVEGWTLATLLFIYWFQSVIIGVFTVAGILALPWTGPEPKNLVHLTIGGREFLRTTRTRWLSVGNFVFMYGVFHFLYFFFIMLLWQMSGQGLRDLPAILFSCAVFFATHLYSYLFYRKQQKPGRFSEYELVAGPMKRIIPMHLAILGGVYFLAQAPEAVTEANRLGVLFFLCLKTLMDMEGHQRKHRQPPGEDTGMEGT